jgi:hypothetical protein
MYNFILANDGIRLPSIIITPFSLIQIQTEVIFSYINFFLVKMGHSKHKKHDHRHDRSKDKNEDDDKHRHRQRSPSPSSTDNSSTTTDEEEYREKKISTKGKTMEQIEEERQAMKEEKR